MAVTINKKSLTIVNLVESLFSADTGYVALLERADELQKAGFKLSLSPSMISIAVDIDKNTTTMVSFQELKLEALNLTLAGKVGYAVKTVIRQKITKLISTAYEYFLEHGKVKVPYEGNGSEFETEIMYQYGKDVNKILAIKTLRGLTGWSLKQSKDMVESWIEHVVGTFPEMPELDNITAGNYIAETVLESNENPTYKSTQSHIMHLKDAEYLHQAVHGSSVDSRYYVIALGDDVKVSARINNGGLGISIRAVCTKSPQSHKGQKVKAGFLQANLVKKSGGHWSLHLQPTDMIMAHRCIGSTLFAMGLTFHSVSGYLEALEGK